MTRSRNPDPVIEAAVEACRKALVELAAAG
jgi:hypothetical protein